MTAGGSTRSLTWPSAPQSPVTAGEAYASLGCLVTLEGEGTCSADTGQNEIRGQRFTFYHIWPLTKLEADGWQRVP